MKTVEERLLSFRRKQVVFTFTIFIINAVIIAGMFVYYNLKQRALIGALYLYDEKAAKNIVDILFRNPISIEYLSAGQQGMAKLGYGEGGNTYLFRLSGEFTAAVVIFVILVLFLIVSLTYIYRMLSRGCIKEILNTFDERKELELSLENERHYNKEQHKKMQDFIENISHQIKTPLAGIILKLEQIDNFTEDENIIMLKEACINNSFKIKKLIKQLMDISRFESGKIVIANEEVELDSVILESVNDCVIFNDKIELDFDDDNLHLHVDEGWLIEGLVNVISNCLESIENEKNGHVYINTRKAADGCFIVISDNGKGLDIEEKNTIFDRFNTGNSSKEVHAGIGLNLTRLIIEAHHGYIKAGNSEKYGGAEFTIFIPSYKLKTK